jgi:hypothetical protein
MFSKQAVIITNAIGQGMNKTAVGIKVHRLLGRRTSVYYKAGAYAAEMGTGQRQEKNGYQSAVSKNRGEGEIKQACEATPQDKIPVSSYENCTDHDRQIRTQSRTGAHKGLSSLAGKRLA